MAFSLGLLAFVFFFLGDWNDWQLQRRGLRFCFPCGFVLLALSCGLQLSLETAPLGGLWRFAGLALGALALCLLLHTLFFAFPAEGAYMAPGQERPLCTSGVYSLCRHPGVLWLSLLLLCLHLSLGLPLHAFLAYSAANVLLVWFEDALVFPALMPGYAEYKKNTPFIIPSARRLISLLRR